MAKSQLKQCIGKFNTSNVNSVLARLQIPKREWVNYHIVPKDSFEEMSSDKQVVLKLTNGYDVRKALNEIRALP